MNLNTIGEMLQNEYPKLEFLVTKISEVRLKLDVIINAFQRFEVFLLIHKDKSNDENFSDFTKIIDEQLVLYFKIP